MKTQGMLRDFLCVFVHWNLKMHLSDYFYNLIHIISHFSSIIITMQMDASYLDVSACLIPKGADG